MPQSARSKRRMREARRRREAQEAYDETCAWRDDEPRPPSPKRPPLLSRLMSLFARLSK